MTFEALERLLETDAEPDDVLRDAISMLIEEPGIAWAGIAFVEQGALVLGPVAGKPDEARRRRVPITYQGESVGELWLDGEADRVLLERVAQRLSALVLVGWDTGGEDWGPRP
ncbi:MAG: hypothetical protein M3364_05905 [Actinomycetota bacterium]|nr:hypothetical protein [Actinomycetota bacterium]